MRRVFIVLFVTFLFLSCDTDRSSFDYTLALNEIPVGFPPIDFPEDNAFTNERWSLGKKLFYDINLSVDKSVSCASCHHHALAFSDNVSVSKGADEAVGTRNSPTLANVAYHPYYMREGGVPTLEMQALVPIQEHAEFNNNIVLIAQYLSTDEYYNDLSMRAYGQNISAYTITRGLANFQRTIISGTSPYDLYTNYGDNNALTTDQIKGMQLFFSDKTNCSKCHSGFNFTNYQFENNGLYEEYKDTGRERLTKKPQDRALFKVPSLRNIAVTGPYMHDGSFETLEDVIDHYDSGGKAHYQKNKDIRPLNLSYKEKKLLIAFLESLTDHYFLTNPLFEE